MPGERQADLERLLRQQNRSSAQNRQDFVTWTEVPRSSRLSTERQQLKPCRKAEVQETCQRPASSLLQALQQDKLLGLPPQKARPARLSSSICHHHQGKRPRLTAVCGLDKTGPGAHAHMTEQPSGLQVNGSAGPRAHVDRSWHSQAGHAMDTGTHLPGGRRAPAASASESFSSASHFTQCRQASPGAAAQAVLASCRSGHPHPGQHNAVNSEAGPRQSISSRPNGRARRDPALHCRRSTVREGCQTSHGARPKVRGSQSHASCQVSSNSAEDNSHV